MTTISDNFTRADSNTSLGSSSEGWSWSVTGTGVWGITSNQAYNVSSTGNTGARADIDLASANHYAQIKINTVDNNPGPCTRYSANANTFYAFIWRPSSTQWQLFKNVAGSFTQLGTGGSSFGSGLAKLISNGSSHTGYVDGVLNMASVTDTSITGNLRTGMMGNRGAGGNIYDNFIAGDVASTNVQGLVMVNRGLTEASGLSPTINKGLVKDELGIITRV